MTGKNFITNSLEIKEQTLNLEEAEQERKDFKKYGAIISGASGIITVGLAAGSLVLFKGNYLAPAIILGTLAPSQALIGGYVAKVTYKVTKKNKVKTKTKRNRK